MKNEFEFNVSEMISICSALQLYRKDLEERKRVFIKFEDHDRLISTEEYLKVVNNLLKKFDL